MLASHNSPYIIKFKTAFLHCAELCLVTEYATNGDLACKIKAYSSTCKKFSENDILHYFIQLCMAIGYLHKYNIIHRDIKPANIFIDENNNIKLGDFGIIKIMKSYMMYGQTQMLD